MERITPLTGLINRSMSVRSFVQDNYKKLKICARDDCRRLSSIATRVLPATRGVVRHAEDGVHTRFSNPVVYRHVSSLYANHIVNDTCIQLNEDTRQ